SCRRYQETDSAAVSNRVRNVVRVRGSDGTTGGLRRDDTDYGAGGNYDDDHDWVHFAGPDCVQRDWHDCGNLSGVQGSAVGSNYCADQDDVRKVFDLRSWVFVLFLSGPCLVTGS